MDETRLLIPFFGMLILTLLVWVYMYIRRISFMVKNRIPAHAGRTPEKMAQILPEAVNTSAYNLRNLFELPVLFYAVCLYLIWAGQVDNTHLNCAYVFFVFRAIHSAIHCTFNNVMMRFGVYIVSSIALWIMVIRAALAL